jgi:hypothetical protein
MLFGGAKTRGPPKPENEFEDVPKSAINVKKSLGAVAGCVLLKSALAAKCLKLAWY